MAKKINQKKAAKEVRVSKKIKAAKKTVDKVKRLRMLLVSDEHEKWEMLDKLVQNVKKNNYKYDVVLMSGDQGNGNNVIVGTNCQQMNKVCEESNKRYVETLEKLAPLMFYIPGNHDAEELFA